MEEIQGVVKNEYGCVFCEIVSGKLPANRIFESDHTLGIMSLEGHPLILSKTHFRNFLDPSLDEETAKDLGLQQRRLSQVIKDVFKADGLVIASLNEKEAGQEVSHLHIHLIPVHAGLKVVRFKALSRLTEEELGRRALLLRSRLNEQL